MRSTFAIWQHEREKMPSRVTVTNATGRVIATIDPVTRVRRARSGKVEGVLTPQGWALEGKDLHKMSFDRDRPWGLYPEAKRPRSLSKKWTR